MHVISRKKLSEFWGSHRDVEEYLKAWFAEAEQTIWHSPEDIKKHYPSADILKDNRVVFNIKGNHYRLVVKIQYHVGIVYIRFVGTHPEYDKIDAEKI